MPTITTLAHCVNTDDMIADHNGQFVTVIDIDPRSGDILAINERGTRLVLPGVGEYEVVPA